MKKHSIILLTLFIASLNFLCQKPKPTPRPVAYFRINLPKKDYKKFNPDTCPYSFDIPTYAKVVPFTDPNIKHDKCWITISFPQFKAELTITYYQIHNNLEQLLDDSYTLAYKHAIRADDIIEKNYIDRKHKVFATVFDITGSAASPMQFHITDSTKNFFRASLYFRVTPNRDSLQPAIDFLEKDLIHMIETFQWRND